LQRLDCAAPQLYKHRIDGNSRGATNDMSATTGDKHGDGRAQAGNPASVARSLAISGNRIDSRELFASEREIIIAHGEENYRLRLTSQNKLILTK
jgi:hemin uptake protein HemP